MAYVGATPWHGLGARVEAGMTIEQMMKAANLDWTVSLRPFAYNPSRSVEDGFDATDTSKPVKAFRALVRDSDDSLLDIVGSRFLPTQNAEAFAFFNEYLEAGEAHLETMGSLDHGRNVWALANLGASFTLKGGDNVKSYLLLSLPHKQGKAIRSMLTCVRVVCTNTLGHALSAGGGFSQSHRLVFDKAMQKKAKEQMGIAREKFDERKAEAETLVKMTMTKSDQQLFLTQLIEPELFAQGVQIVRDTIDAKKASVRLQHVLTSLDSAPGAMLSSAKGTAWGTLNAVTHAVDHVFGKGQDQRLNKAWFGTGARLKTAANAALLKMAQA
jgi:phage/plasmid-like protein (TIGR03299 family)